MQIIDKLPKPLHNVLSFCANCIRHSPRFAWLYANRFKGLTKDQIKYLLINAGNNVDFTNPKTFTQKLQWLKVYYQDSLLTQCADKVMVREYVKSSIGEQYLIPLLGTYDKTDQIPFADLPCQFVLKVNWGSGQNIICKDKQSLNVKKAIRQINKWMEPTSNHYYDFFEWCYKNIQPKILAEHYIEQLDGFLIDYKIHVFNGEPILLQFIDRWESHKETIYYIPDWTQTELHFTYEKLNRYFKKDATIEHILNLSRKLAKPFPYVRVDFYNINGKIYFGELTFYPGGGMLNMPQYWAKKLGDFLILPESKQ